MSWDLDGGGNKKTEFTKFPVGVTRIRVLSESPHMRWVHWMNQFQRSVTCPGQGCPIDEMRRTEKANDMPYTYNSSRTFAMNIYNHDMGRYEIMEQGITFMEDLRDVMEDLKEKGIKLEDVIIKVRRTGTNKDNTRYRIDAEDVTPLSAEEQRAKDGMVNLIEHFKPNTVEQIKELLAVVATSPDGYKEAWKRIIEGNDDAQKDEEIEVEG